MTLPTQAITATHSYPRIRYGSPALTLDLPRSLVGIAPRSVAERHVNRVSSGRAEYLYSREEETVALDLRCTADTYQALRWFYEDWAATGEQFELWLDRFQGSAWLFANSLRDQNRLALTLNGGGSATYADGPAIDGRGLVLGAAQYLSVLIGQIAGATGFDDPLDKAEGVIVVDCKPAFAHNDAAAHHFVQTLNTGGTAQNRLTLRKLASGALEFEIQDAADAPKAVSGTVPFASGDRLRLVASWATDGTLAAWAQVNQGGWVALTTATGAGTGILSALGTSLFIGSDHSGGDRAPGTYETVAFYKRAFPTPHASGLAEYRPVKRNYFATAEMAQAAWAPVRESLTQQLWRWQMAVRAGVKAEVA